MKYTKYEYDNYTLHIVNTKKFVRTYMQVDFRTSLTEEKYNYLLMLSSLLTYSTKKYNTNQLLSRELLNNYDNFISCSSYISGNNIIVNLYNNSINDKLVNDRVFDKSLDILNEVIFNPNIMNNKFDKKSFDIVYKRRRDIIKESKENMRGYATTLMLKKMNKNSPAAIANEGNIKILKKINEENLVNSYNDLLNNSKIDIFVLGDIDEEDIKEKINKKFSKLKPNKEKYSCYYETKIGNKIKECIKEKNTNQAKLIMGFDLTNLTSFERSCVLPIYNYILGGSATSRLFNNVREKASLAYYASSSIMEFDNILIISTGIDKKNYKKTYGLIMDNIKDLETNITDEEIKQAIENKVSKYNENFDYGNVILNMYYTMILKEKKNIDEVINGIQKVSKKDLYLVAKKIKLNTVYLYGGDKVGKN